MDEIKLSDIPVDILKRFEERCKIFAYLIENEPLPCKCSDNVEGRLSILLANIRYSWTISLFFIRE